MRDFIGFFTIVVIPLALILGAVFIAGHFYGEYQCGKYSQITGKETVWAAFDSCYIKESGTWMRWDEYKIRFMAYDGLKK